MLLAVASAAHAGSRDMERLFEEHLWRERVLVVFTPEVTDSRYRAQLAINAKAVDILAERDFVIWEVVGSAYVRLNGAVQPQRYTGAFREHFSVAPDAFTVIILGKDGEEKLREGAAVSAETMASLIDAMPMRQREMKR